MADNTSKETVVFEIDVSSYEKSLANLTKSINELKAQQKDFQEQTKKGVAGAAEAYERVSAELKVQQQQYRTTQAALVGYTASQKKGVDTSNFFNNSIQTNRDLLKQLTAEYIRTKNPSEQFTKKIKDVSDALKQQEAAIGDNRRNVGAYADAFKSALGQLTGFGGQVVAVGQNLGGAVNAFKAAEGGVKGFGAALATTGLPLFVTAVNALSDAFAEFKPIADAVEDVMSGLAASFRTSYEDGVALSRLKRELEDADRDAIVLNAKLQDSIAELEIQAKDKTKSDSERISLLEQANKKREELLRGDIDRAKKQEEISRREVAQSEAKNKSTGKYLSTLLNSVGLYEFAAEVQVKSAEASDEALKSQSESIANVIKLETQYKVAVQENNNAINKLRQQAAEERSKIENGAISKALQEQQAGYDKFNKAYDKQQEELKKKEDEKEQREINAKLRRELRILNDIGTEQAAIDAIILQRNIDLQNQDLTETERLLIIEESEKKIAETRKKYRDKNTNETEENAKKLIDIEKARLAAASSISDSIIGFISDVADASGANAAFQKTLAFFEIATKTAIGLAGAISQAQSVPFPANLGAIAAGVAAVLSGIGSAVALLRKSGEAPKAPKFATGVIGLDGAGTETSDSIDAKLSKGESVMTAKATKRFHRELAYMEMAVGNKPNYNFSSKKFADGVIGTGGFTTREISNTAEQAAFMRASIIEGFKNSPQPVVAVKEINSVNKGLTRSVAVSEL